MGISERKERDRKEMRTHILNTAMNLFVDEGYATVSIRNIAEKIEYSPATIYLYFKDKDEILYALHSLGFEKFYEQQSSVLQVADPLERLNKQGENYVEFGLDNPEFYDLMFIMKAPARKFCEEKDWSVGMKAHELLKQNIQECVGAGYFQTDNIDAATYAIWSFVHGLVSLIIRQRVRLESTEQAKMMCKAAFRFMMNNFGKIPYELSGIDK